jgi:hypothetical protein
MDAEIRNLILDAEGRYLTRDESWKVLELVRNYERRLEIMRAVEEKEMAIVRYTLEKAFDRFPKFAAERAMSYEKGERDVTLVLRYACMAMLQGDPEWFREKVLYWFKTIVDAMVFADVAKYTYEVLQEAILRNIRREDAEEVNRYIQIAADYLGSGA